ncbi:MAG TPA: hypothetical protein VM737_08375, partial [Gemmatimonadota bacterium]|nr:hypothetical protein [Gemmatimonadota bacterium]
MTRLLALLTILLFLGAARTLLAQHADHGDDVTSVVAGPVESDLDAETQAELEGLRQAIAHYADHAHAVADGYRRFGHGLDDPLVGEHWYRPDLTRAPLDLYRPSTLIYQEIDGRRELVGVAYANYQPADEPLPGGFTGAGDVWHVHDMSALLKAAAAERPLLGRIVERRARESGVLVMLHVWPYGDNPDGPFAHYNSALPYRAVGLPAESVLPGGGDAARGIALLQDGACEIEVGRTETMAKLDETQKEALMDACEAAAAEMTGARAVFAVTDTNGTTALNAAAAQVWLDLEATRE